MNSIFLSGCCGHGSLAMRQEEPIKVISFNYKGKIKAK